MEKDTGSRGVELTEPNPMLFALGTHVSGLSWHEYLQAALGSNSCVPGQATQMPRHCCVQATPSQGIILSM